MAETERFSPKLKQARAEIEQVLKRFDIAGHVILHEPGFGEIFAHLTPSYSNLIGELPLIRLRSKAADYGGDKQAQRRDVEATANMLSIMATLLAEAALSFIDLSTFVDKQVGAEHGDGTFTPDPDKDLH